MGYAPGANFIFTPRGRPSGMPRFARPFRRAHGSLVVFYWMTIFDAAVLRLAHAVGGLHHKTCLAAADHRFTAWHDAATAPCLALREDWDLQPLGMQLFCMVNYCIEERAVDATFAWGT
jgi:hypothetical protein